MKLLKKDQNYKYYELSEREQDENCVWEDVIAIELKTLKFMKAKEALEDGEFKKVSYDTCKNPHYVIDVYEIVLDSLKVVD